MNLYSWEEIKTEKRQRQSSKKEKKIFIILSRRTGCLGRRCGGSIGEVKAAEE